MALNLVARLSLDDQLSNRLGRINNNMNKTQNSANRLSDSVKGIGSSIATIGGAIGLTAAVAGGFNMVRNSIGGAMDRIDTMEQFDRVMTVMTGSSERAAAALATTNEAVTGTAYGLDVAAKSVQGFVTRGMEVEKATELIRIWGDAVAFYGDGSNEQLSTVTDALGKMYSSGKVSMDQMNRLIDLGINPIVEYAKATGRTTDAVEADLSSGRISAEEFIDTVGIAFMEGTNGVTKIAGAAKEAGATWDAAVGNMKNAIARGVVDIIGSIDEMLTSSGLPDMRAMVAEFGKRFEAALKTAASYIPALVEHLKRLSAYWPLIKNGVIGAVTALVAFRGIMIGMSIVGKVTKLFKAYRAGTLATTAAQMGLNTAMLMNPMTWVAAGIAALIAAGVLLWRNWDTVSAKAKEVWSSIKSSVSDFFSPFLAFIDRAKQGWREFVDSIFNFKMPKIGMPKIFGGGGLIQSHYHGADRIPYDGYPAMLHRGERVLTRQEADALDRFSYGGLMGGGNKGGKQAHSNVPSTQSSGGSSLSGGRPVNLTVIYQGGERLDESEMDRFGRFVMRKLIEAGEAEL